jgi:nucleoside-diphosphate-sugar epimerase
MSKDIHVVLGGSGATGRAVISALQTKKLQVRAVERSKKVEGVESVFADLLDQSEASEAIKDASHVYLCVGLPYRSDVWQRDWPKLMQSIINACAENNARLIFFDNIYMYGPGPLSIPFDEKSPQHPTTNKGKARKETADLLLNAHKSGKVNALIGRSADFYGPNAINSPFYISFIERINKGKNPQVLAKKGMPHTYAYSLDNGRALVELALNNSAYGQVWHLPVGEPITIDNAITMMNRIMGSSFKASYMPRSMLGLISIIVPPVKEVKEMLYQFDNPYVMSDKKFKNQYPNFHTTSYEDGFKAMIDSFKNGTTHKSNL